MDLKIDIVPAQPDAGAPLAVTLVARGFDQAKTELVAVLQDAQGHELATASVTRDDDGSARASLSATAPANAGDCRWMMSVCAGGETLARQDLAFDVVAHVIRPIVWDVPPAITADKQFRVHVGLGCTAGCPTATWTFVVEDEAGQPLVSSLTGSTPVSGTRSLHATEIELKAPDREGRYLWRVRPVDPAGELPHELLATDIHLNVVSSPDHLIRVRVVDAESRRPVERARVIAHPFRTLTDAAGCAEIAVPRGAYSIFVSGLQYFPFKQEADVQGDVEIVAEMHVDRVYDEVDQWA